MQQCCRQDVVVCGPVREERGDGTRMPDSRVPTTAGTLVRSERKAVGALNESGTIAEVGRLIGVRRRAHADALRVW